MFKMLKILFLTGKALCTVHWLGQNEFHSITEEKDLKKGENIPTLHLNLKLILRAKSQICLTRDKYSVYYPLKSTCKDSGDA